MPEVFFWNSARKCHSISVQNSGKMQISAQYYCKRQWHYLQSRSPSVMVHQKQQQISWKESVAQSVCKFHHRPEWHITHIWVIFPRTGKMRKMCHIFFWSFTLTKRFDFFKFSQLFWRDYVCYSLKILLFTLQKKFAVPCSTPVFALLSDFWVKIRALVRPNRQRWTGFDLLIIFLVKFWWFSFFLKPL